MKALEEFYNRRYMLARARLDEICANPQLGPVTRSYFSELVANAESDLRAKYGFDDDLVSVADELKREWHVFVVGHDYARAFAGAEGLILDLRESKLPYERTVWEFNINKVACCVCITRDELTPWYRFDGGWMPFVGDDTGHFAAANVFFAQQIAAVCIALDSQIAEEVRIAAPRPNSAVRRGRSVAKNEYHAIRLKGRRAGGGPYSHRSQGIVRLHFRRGHWRHVDPENDQVRTWVKWTLVGNPDLGFIDKHYRL